MSTLRNKLDRIRARIGEACVRVGRDPLEITLVAVSKTFSVERVRELLDAGHDVLGENRVQEALAKIDDLGVGARWHLVGSLQKNKARHVVGRFELIHSVDSVGLATEIEKRASAAGITQRVLVQVNQAAESTKSGVAPDDVKPLVERLLDFQHVEVRGLMSIPPRGTVPEDSRRWFAELRGLRDGVAGCLGHPLPELSIGMSDDFEVAVEEGSTLIRVGRALFGERKKSPHSSKSVPE